MSGSCPARSGDRALARFGALAILGALVLSGAVLPHAHEASDPGLHDQEHDFRLLAMSSGGALVAAVPTLPVLAVATSLLSPPRAWPLPARAHREASRAPPVPLHPHAG